MLLVAGAVAGEIRVQNISTLSKQADTAILDALVRAGASVIDDGDSITVARRELRGFEFDATQCPDLFPALVALASQAEGETVLKGTNRLLHKESNRAETLYEEYTKLGIRIDISEEDTMRVWGGKIRATEVESHNDHRIAMSLAVAGLCSDGAMVIHGAECVAKSYPDFFEQIESVRVK